MAHAKEGKLRPVGWVVQKPINTNPGFTVKLDALLMATLQTSTATLETRAWQLAHTGSNLLDSNCQSKIPMLWWKFARLPQKNIWFDSKVDHRFQFSFYKNVFMAFLD